MKAPNHLRAHAVDAEGDKFVGVGNLQSFGTQCLNESRVHAKDAERDQLVGVEVAEVLILHLLCEIEADILHRHAELLLAVHREAKRMHLARVVRIRLEMEQSRTFAVIEKSLAL